MPKGDKLTLKQRKWIKEYIATGNATEAAMRVYDVKSRGSAEVIGTENLGKLRLDELMNEMGLTDISLLNVGAEGMTKAVKQSITGEVHPDYAVRHKYWETMLKLKRHLTPNKEITNSIGQIVVNNRYAGGLNDTDRSRASSSTGGMERSNEIQGVSVASES